MSKSEHYNECNFVFHIPPSVGNEITAKVVRNTLTVKHLRKNFLLKKPFPVGEKSDLILWAHLEARNLEPVPACMLGLGCGHIMWACMMPGPTYVHDGRPRSPISTLYGRTWASIRAHFAEVHANVLGGHTKVMWTFTHYMLGSHVM